MLFGAVFMTFKLENVFKKYKKNYVLERFSYEFNEGLYLLIGPNGSGKSTTLKIISKMINPSNDNFSITKVKSAYLCEKFELGNQKVLSFLKSVKKLNNSKINLKEELKKWNIPNKYIANLSKGNKQKCGILMMKLAETEIYLFDEPTDALDQISIELFVEFINELIIRKKTILIATHEKEYFKSLQYVEVKF